MDDINLNDWLNRKQITLDECLLLSMRENPNNPDTNTEMWEILCGNEYRERQNEAEQWIKNGELKARKINNHDFDEYINLNPLSFFELARLKDWALSESIHDFLDKHQNLKNITWSGNIQPLEPLTDEQRHGYNKLAAWTWVDAIYILQNYIPVYQLSTEQVRSRFPQQVHDFTQSIQLGNIGKEITQAGERTFIDSPANWEAFWQGINKPEPQAEALGDAGAVSHAGTEPKERELTAWLRETWINEGKLGGTAFFTRLKKYEKQKGSPIVEHYSAGKDAGFRWETSAGTTGRMTKKTIQSKVSIFNNKS